ncbi:sensor histidine kinase [Polaribacter marinivivus]|uniref:Sensor histidine kinase n=1 Tax=Polaribacter marinivivus TaxID=1524260 RepID=A0ABV8RD18_9FLAO
MNRFFNSLVKAFGFTLIIHSVVFAIQFFLNAFDLDEILEIIGLTIPFLLIPAFLSFYIFEKNLVFKKIITKVFSLNFILIFIIVYINFRFINENLEHSIFSFINFIIAIISSFISFFITFYQKINSTEITQLKNNSKKIEFSYFKTFSISLTGTFLYVFLAAIDTFYFEESIKIIYTFLPLGFIFSVLSIHFFNYVYSQFSLIKQKLYILSYYILSISFLVFWIILSFNNFRIVKNGLGPSLDRAFLIPTILLYTPFFLFVLIITHFYFLQLINKQKAQILKQETLETQLNYQQLKNQLSPHFLFNNINVLSSFIEENPQKAVSYANNLADIYHYFLEQEKQDVVKVVDEINFAEKYLQLLKDRFEEGLDYTISIDSETKQKFIVATILQQVLENVIKHNIIDKTSLIHINISSKENYLIVSNNKNLKRNKQLTSNKGIENIKQRNAFFTEEKVIIEDTNETYCIKLPILETI